MIYPRTHWHVSLVKEIRGLGYQRSGSGAFPVTLLTVTNCAVHFVDGGTFIEREFWDDNVEPGVPHVQFQLLMKEQNQKPQWRLK
jgi:hypothetical protein